MDEDTVFKWLLGAIVVFVALAILNPLHLIGAGEQAVVFNRITNAISTRSTGLVWVTPLVNQTKKYSIRTTKTEYSDIEGLSSDSQTLRLNIVVNWRLSASKLTDIYRNIQGNVEDTIMLNAVIDTTKAELGKFKIDDIARNREFLRDGVQKALSARLVTNGIIVDNTSITNVDFNEDYEKAIEKKMIAQQGALEAANNKEKARQDAEAVRYTSQTMTNIVLRQKWIEKWDGKLPVYMAGEQAGMIMNMGSTSQ